MDIKLLIEGLGANKEEVLRKGSQCKSAEEIMQLAQENGLAINEAGAAELLALIQLEPNNLLGDELNGVSAGGVYLCPYCGHVPGRGATVSVNPWQCRFCGAYL